jgi:hypothetical protein
MSEKEDERVESSSILSLTQGYVNDKFNFVTNGILSGSYVFYQIIEPLN